MIDGTGVDPTCNQDANLGSAGGRASHWVVSEEESDRLVIISLEEMIGSSQDRWSIVSDRERM